MQSQVCNNEFFELYSLMVHGNSIKPLALIHYIREKENLFKYVNNERCLTTFLILLDFAVKKMSDEELRLTSQISVLLIHHGLGMEQLKIVIPIIYQLFQSTSRNPYQCFELTSDYLNRSLTYSWKEEDQKS